MPYFPFSVWEGTYRETTGSVSASMWAAVPAQPCGKFLTSCKHLIENSVSFRSVWFHCLLSGWAYEGRLLISVARIHCQVQIIYLRTVVLW